MEKTIANYKLLRLLGQGGMGSVYEARHTTIERRVAIKVLHPEFSKNPDVVKRFLNEARAVNIIAHHNLVSISEFGQTPDGVLYMVMEYLEGETLRERLKKCGKMTLAQVLPIARQIAAALEAAHAKQIIHRDLKPANIMLVADPSGGAEEHVKVLDFGLAKLSADNDQRTATQTGVIMGTPRYMSPEQCRSGRNAVERSDVYALGIILYELLSGDPPFRGSDAVLLADHLLTPAAPLHSRVSGIPLDLSALVGRMLAKSPGDRPPASEVVRLLGIDLTAAPPVQTTAGTVASPERSAELFVREAPSPATVLLAPGPRGARGKLIGVVAVVVLVLGLAGSLAVLRLLLRSPAAPAVRSDLAAQGEPLPAAAAAQDAGTGRAAASSAEPALTARGADAGDGAATAAASGQTKTKMKRKGVKRHHLGPHRSTR